ncbi:MAG: hypothetical protein ACKO96_30565 [Flammeovirgaceae bacterium]
MVDERVVIPAGSIAQGQVIRAQKARGLGKQGFIEIQIKSVKVVDGQNLLLTAPNLFNEGEDAQTLAIVLGLVVCILFLTIKGKEATVPVGYKVSSVAATSLQIKV